MGALTRTLHRVRSYSSIGVQAVIGWLLGFPPGFLFQPVYEIVHRLPLSGFRQCHRIICELGRPRPIQRERQTARSDFFGSADIAYQRKALAVASKRTK